MLTRFDAQQARTAPKADPRHHQPQAAADDDPLVTQLQQRWQLSTQSRWPLWNSVFWISLLGLLTRIWQLDYHSVWFDEAVSLQWAGSDATFIWQKTFPLLEDKHPPAYYLSLHYWQSLLGWIGLAQNDAALRLLGVLYGLVTVWAIMQLATSISGRRTGMLSGLLVALSPVLVWYSQELRMFQPATALSTVAALALWQAWHAPTVNRQWLGWVCFLLTMTAALYSYLFSAFLMPAAGLTLLVLFLHSAQPDRWQRFGRGLLMIGLTGLLFLPLAYNAWIVNGSEGDPGVAFANVSSNLWRLLRIFTLWRVQWSPTWLISAALGFFAIALLIGLLLPTRATPPNNQQPTQPRTWLWLWIGIPLLIGNILQSRSESVFGEDRYFLFLAPFVLWAIARGLVVASESLPRLLRLHSAAGRVSVFGTGGIAVSLLFVALLPLWTPAMYRENWRAAANQITAYHAASPGLSSVVVAHVDYTRLPLEWYLRQQHDFADLPLYHPFGGTLTPEEIEQTVAPPLQGIVDTGAATLWLTQSHLAGVDEARLVEGWLEQRFPLVTELHPAGIKVSGFALQSHFATLPPLAPGSHLPAAMLAPGLELAACEVMTPVLAAQENEMHPPSGWVHVRLWWRATAAITDDYVATAEVVGVEGAWGVRLYRANEALRRWPTSSWQPGELVRDEVDINLNPLTPSRTYPVVIGLLDSAGVPTGQTTECGTVIVE